MPPMIGNAVAFRYFAVLLNKAVFLHILCNHLDDCTDITHESFYQLLS